MYSGPSLISYAYAYDPGNRLTSQTYNNGTPIVYGYDKANELTSVSGGQTASYVWDAAGNRTNNSFSLGGDVGNQLACPSNQRRGCWGNYAVGRTDTIMIR